VVPGFRAPFPTTGRAIVDMVCGFPPSELAKDQTFDVRVKPANIEEHFERRHIARERYIAANAETEAEIAALYHGNPVSRVELRFSCGPPKLCAVILGEIKMQQG
jgi:hypothetical protein